MKNRSKRPPRPPRDPKVAPKAIFNQCFVNFGSNLVPILSQKSMKKCVKNRLVFRSCFSSIFDRFLMPKIIPKSSENRSESAVIQKSAIPWFCSPFHHFLMIFHAQGDQKPKKNRWKILLKTSLKINIIFYRFLVDFASQNRSKNR